MRTTITIEDNLLAKLKRRASETGSSVSRLIEEAARVMVNQKSSVIGEPDEFDLVTFGAGGRFSTHNIDKTSSLLEADDLDEFTRRDP
jgi:predicted transcriptional regulator